ncbi:MAG: aminomethyl-transferring glycine dehydrogenase subunit GcvPA [Candidatus Omnitrophica bacterium]|nr:aminomethyl-transferring glycine dehydrogenase subunit GcvPA [Candidatus Omnitrophota bacterium]
MPYVSHTPQDQDAMCAAIGVRDPRDLFREIPDAVRLSRINLPGGLTELELSRRMRELAAKTEGTHSFDSYLGAGSYEHFIPSVVSAIVSRGEFETAYTPYQAEASQGTLQWIFEFQSLIAKLTGMDVANASHYDGASALAEGAMLATFARKRPRILISETVHPEYRRVVRTYLSGLDVELVEIPMLAGGRPDWEQAERLLDERVNALLVSSPNFFGQLEDIEVIAPRVHKAGALLVESSNPIALALVKTPGEHGADVSVGEAQPLGLAPAWGGPYCGWFAARQELTRRLPGRLVSETRDRNGRKAYVLTLQTREQHIRREKATSNICTNQGLCALTATVTLACLGPEGLKEMAELNTSLSHYAYDRLLEIDGVTPFTSGPFFNEFAVRFPKTTQAINLKLLKKGIIGGFDLGRIRKDWAHACLFAVTETKTEEKIDRLVQEIKACLI